MCVVMCVCGCVDVWMCVYLGWVEWGVAVVVAVLVVVGDSLQSVVTRACLAACITAAAAGSDRPPKSVAASSIFELITLQR